MVLFIGNHTSLTPLSEEILELLKSEKDIKVSPGLIVRKNIKIRTQKIIIKSDKSSVLLTVLMKGSKQFLRLYNSRSENLIVKFSKFCRDRNILLQSV